MYLSALNDEELLRHAYSSLNPIVTTDLERELFQRLEAFADHASLISIIDEHEIADAEALLGALAEADLRKPEDLKAALALLEVLAEAEIEKPEDLKAALDLATNFRSLAEDAGYALPTVQE